MDLQVEIMKISIFSQEDDLKRGSDQKESQTTEASLDQNQRERVGFCGTEGHFKRECPKRNNEGNSMKAEASIGKAQVEEPIM